MKKKFFSAIMIATMLFGATQCFASTPAAAAKTTNASATVQFTDKYVVNVTPTEKIELGSDGTNFYMVNKDNTQQKLVVKWDKNITAKPLAVAKVISTTVGNSATAAKVNQLILVYADSKSTMHQATYDITTGKVTPTVITD